jgi:hypothetical protein
MAAKKPPKRASKKTKSRTSKAPPGVRARKKSEQSLEKDARIEACLKLMRAFRWERGITYRHLARQFGVAEATMRKDASEAFRQFRVQLGTAEMEEDLSQWLVRLDGALRRAFAKGDFRSVATLLDLEAKVRGFHRPQRFEHSGPGGQPLEISARAALTERLAGLITSATAESEAGSDPSDAE